MNTQHASTPRATAARRAAAATATPLPVLALALAAAVTAMLGIVGGMPPAAAQEAGEKVVLAPEEVTADRLIELLAPPAATRMALGPRRAQPQPPRCAVYRRRLTRGIEIAATTPVPAIPIEFAFNSAVLGPAAVRTLSEIGKALASPTLNGSCFRLDGFTDNVGSDAVNDRLSQRRAEAAVHFLTTRFSIEPQRLLAHGLGKRTPIADNATDEGRQRNRRVQIVNMGAGEAAP